MDHILFVFMSSKFLLNTGHCEYVVEILDSVIFCKVMILVLAGTSVTEWST